MCRVDVCRVNRCRTVGCRVDGCRGCRWDGRVCSRNALQRECKYNCQQYERIPCPVFHYLPINNAKRPVQFKINEREFIYQTVGWYTTSAETKEIDLKVKQTTNNDDLGVQLCLCVLRKPASVCKMWKPAAGISYGGGRWCAAFFGLHRPVGETRAAATTRRLVTRTGTNHDWSPRRSGSKLLFLRTCYFKFRFYTVSLRLRFYSNHYIIINDIILFYFTEFSECYRFKIPSAYVFMSKYNNYNNNSYVMLL